MYIDQNELLDKAKEQINLVEYAKSLLPSHEFKKVGKSIFVEECPICKGHNHFSIYKDKNFYNSFANCCKGGSVIDFMIEVEHLSQKDAIRKTLELAGYGESIGLLDGKCSEANHPKDTVALEDNNHEPKTGVSFPNSPDFTSLILKTHSLVSETDYFLNRGLTAKTIEEYKLGYHQGGLNFAIKESLMIEEKENELMGAYKYYLPVRDVDGVCRYFITRVDEGSVPSWATNYGKTHNPKGMKIRLFNDRYLHGYKIQGEFVFITEGIFDALSLEEFDYPAIALNSAENAKLFLETLRQAPENIRSKTFILIPDNDKSGENLRIKLVSGFKELGLKLEVIELPKEHKDCNDFLVANREGFMRCIQKHLNILQRNDFAIDYLDDFWNKILDESDKPVMRTGFAGLDAKLGGGLSAGLYIIGAESSLGKTTLVLQIADSIASNGDDVLFFSVEMGRNELLNRSISRELYLMNPRNKYSSREIRTCPLDVLINVKENYEGKIASNIAIIEANFGLGVKEIRERVEQNVKFRGKFPLVIVDYFQILKPLNLRMNEKQASDYNISELKRISRDFDIPVIAVSSLNRSNYRTVIGYESLKESGSLEYSGDVIIGMQLSGIKDIVNAKTESEKRNLENKLKEQDPRGIELAIIKQRNGIPYCKQSFRYFTKVNYFQEVS
jgi:replicative DNA helicase